MTAERFGRGAALLSLRATLVLGMCLGGFRLPAAAIPAAEKLLPQDTLLLLESPNFAALSESARKLPEYLLWQDSAMRPFREKFLARWNEEFVRPLERELGLEFDNYHGLLQGQLTLALVPRDDDALGLLLLLDTRNKSGQLRKNLAELRKKWFETGKTLRNEKIRDVDFTIVTLSTNDVPKTIRKFFPPSSEVQEVGDDTETLKPAPRSQLVFGQFDSLLIVANSTRTAEQLMVRLAGGSLPCLADLAAYQQNHLACFRDAPLYLWINAKALLDNLFGGSAPKDNPAAPNPFDIKPEKVLNALGISALKTLALSARPSNDGLELQLLLAVPETGRQGIFKVLAGNPKDSRPPAFVPGDVVKFRRWRLDGKKTWAALEKIVNDISPQWLTSINFLLDTADLAAKEKDPGFNIRKNLIGNLGDDLITFQSAPRHSDAADLQPGSSLFLLGSPDPEQLAAAFKSILVYFTQQAGAAPEEREFLGRKIYTVSLAPMPLPVGSSANRRGPVMLSYAASGGYVAFSSDAGVLEEFLRSSGSQRKSLGEAAGLAEAAARVLGPGSSLFGYEDHVQSARAAFELLKQSPGSTPKPVAVTSASLIPGSLPVAGARQTFAGLMDFSLLPSFERIARYFSFSVYGGSTSVDGLTFKMFVPTPPLLRATESR